MGLFGAGEMVGFEALGVCLPLIKQGLPIKMVNVAIE